MFFTPSQGPEITWDVIEDKYLIVTVCGIYDAADLLCLGKGPVFRHGSGGYLAFG